MTHLIRQATADDAGRLAELAAVTFPLACPPESRPEDIAAHLANTLSETSFRGSATRMSRCWSSTRTGSSAGTAC